MQMGRFTFLLAVVSGCLASAAAQGQTLQSEVALLIENACIDCHDASTETGLDLENLKYDLSDRDTFRVWEQVFARVESGEMPPAAEARPDPAQLAAALESLKRDLHATSYARQQTVGRVPARRLTKREYQYTIQDLLKVEGDVSSSIPAEVDAGSFDTVGSTQRISAIHMESYLQSADTALDRALQLGRRPYRKKLFDFHNSPFLNEFHDKELTQGGNVTRKLDKGVALFVDVDYLLTSSAHGFNVSHAGTYRVSTTVEAIQTEAPITFKLILKQPSGAATLITSRDLQPNEPETIVEDIFLNPGDLFYPTLVSNPIVYLQLASVGSKKYRGPGMAIRSQTVEGPMHPDWPPASTKQLLQSVRLDPKRRTRPENGPFQVGLSEPPSDHLSEDLERFAAKAFRRPLNPGELDSYRQLGQAAIDEGRDYLDALRVSLRSMLSSPQFLMFGGDPGKLDDYALANRLSYFLWKSMPDEELFGLAAEGRLADPDVLHQQVERMLGDQKSERFVRDFLGQWLHLYQLNATSPDEKLYPEYDELLGMAMQTEPELFFTELIRENLSVANLVDSDFVFVNRRLAEHYRIEGVEGQNFRKIELPADSPRGGILTQAAVLKTTANGTVTSPVTRGNFVLTNLLGTPPSPPPPSVGSIEPDTRGKTTIREILAAHRDIETCNQCHRSIDPPGFALESFDPIGKYRTSYRANAKPSFFNGGKTYKRGPKVDPSGITADGKKFSGIQQFKQHLLDEQEQIAKNFVSKLVVFATGGELQFADRDALEEILAKTRKDEFLVRDIIHQVVQSELFRNK